ncbi:MAG: hypothetical protein EBT33_22055 [Betaproteobacteria bacterium]|nr:hypothetical protein [Betaproteobacteria bacterium]
MLLILQFLRRHLHQLQLLMFHLLLQMFHHHLLLHNNLNQIECHLHLIDQLQFEVYHLLLN